MRRVILILSTSVLVLSACGSDDSTSPPPETTTTSGSETTDEAPAEPALQITMANIAFSGDETGSVGDTIEVVNEDGVTHTWTAVDGTFNSGNLSSGEAFTFTFEQPGTFEYFCQIHAEMQGSITIEG